MDEYSLPVEPARFKRRTHCQLQLSQCSSLCRCGLAFQAAALLRVWVDGLAGVHSGSLMQLLGKLLNAWARHAVAASAHLATQEDHRDELQTLTCSVLGEPMHAAQRRRLVF